MLLNLFLAVLLRAISKEDKKFDEEEDMENERPKKLNENFDSFDRDILKKKFFELNNTNNS